MNLYIKAVDGRKDLVHEFYSNHGTFHDGDSGFDIFCLENIIIEPNAISVKVPLGICTEAVISGNPTGFYLYPRSSTGSKTPVRLSNSVGIIDAGYRGELIAIVDNISDQKFMLVKGERYFQICAPNLGPIGFAIVDHISDTDRGIGGLGRTGN